MPSLLVTCTGEGTADLGGSVQVVDTFCTIVTAGPTVHYQNSTPPRKIKHAGWIGLGFVNDHGFPSSFNLPFMEVWKWLDHEQEDSLGISLIYNTGYIYADTLFFYAEPLTTFTCWVQWN